MQRNNGVKSEEIFENFIKSQGSICYLERMPDHKEVSRGGKLKNVSLRATPADYLLTWYGDMAYAEVKSSNNKTSFPFSNFTTGQNRAMKRQHLANGDYLIFIHNLNNNQWYMLKGEYVLHLKSKGIKSIKWTDNNLKRRKDIEEFSK